MTKKQDLENATLRAWHKSLVACSADVLDRIIKAAARHFRQFGFDPASPQDQPEYQAALAGDARAKTKYVLGFDPLFTDDGLVAFLVANASRWGLQVPADAAPNAAVGTGRARRAGASTMTERQTRDPNVNQPNPSTMRKAAPGKKSPAPVPLELVIPGDHARVALALGFRKVPSPKGSTVLKENARIVVTAEAGRGIVATCRPDDVAAAVRFARNRTAEEPKLRARAIITTKRGDVPELPERVVTRGSLKRTSKGYRLADVAA